MLPTKRWAPFERQPPSAAPRDKTVRRAVARARAVEAASGAEVVVRAQLRRRGAPSLPSGWHETNGRISAKRLLPGGPSRRLRGLGTQPAPSGWPRPRRSGTVDHHRGRRPGVWAPGDVLVFDWGQRGPLFVFCAVLAWSRFRFVYFADNLGGAEAPWRRVAECMETIGGRGQNPPHRSHGLPEGRQAWPGSSFRHRTMCASSPTRDTSGLLSRCGPRVEGPGREPGRLREGRPRHPRRASASPTWRAPMPKRPQQVEHRSERAGALARSPLFPAERLEIERPLLRPAAGRLRARIGKVALRKVDRLSCVRFGSARYSVPTAHIGRTVEPRVADGVVMAVFLGEIIAEHRARRPR